LGRALLDRNREIADSAEKLHDANLLQKHQASLPVPKRCSPFQKNAIVALKLRTKVPAPIRHARRLWHVEWRTKLVSFDGRLDEVSRMNINLTPEQEQIVKDKLRSGHFRTAEDVIAEALVALRERESSPVAGEENGEYSDAVREMLSFVEKNRIRLEDISVKQLIHEGHHL
jgi:hypothetical protein